MAQVKCDICVIGAGSAGLSVAAGAAQLGLQTILIEQNKMGGECLNFGCVPSKAFLSLAKRAAEGTDARKSAAEQLQAVFSSVKDGVQSTVDTIAPHDSVERFEGLGVKVLRAPARFRDAGTIEVGADTISARHFVIASGSRPALPNIEGLDPARVLTNESIFALRERPNHLIIIGGGPIGIEMAVAHRRLGIDVTIVELFAILPHDEPELVDMLRTKLSAAEIVLIEHAAINSVRHDDAAVTVTVQHDGVTQSISGTHLLAAAGRRPNTEGLGLEKAGVKNGPRGIDVDPRMRTSNRSIFALGDVVDAPRFTHVAGYQAGIVVRNVAFRLPAKASYDALPWVTYTDPELAHVGMTEVVARKEFGDAVTAITLPLNSNDRAVTDGLAEGAIKIVIGSRGRILGASIFAPAAGEMISMWCMAVGRKLTLRAVSDLMLPYPTLSEIGKAAASRYYSPALFSDRTRRIVRLLQWLPAW